MKYLLLLFTVLSIPSCSTIQEPSWVAVVEKCIDSGEIKEGGVRVIESDYDDFVLYYINGSSDGIIETAIDFMLTPSKIMKYKNKRILFFELNNRENTNNPVEFLEDDFNLTGYSDVSWFYLVNKKTKKEVLIRNEAWQTSPFDVSIIRDLITNRSINDTISMDIAVRGISFDCVEESNHLTNTKEIHTHKLIMNFGVYSRGNSYYPTCPPLDSLGKFVLLYKKDTLVIETAHDISDLLYEQGGHRKIKREKIKVLIPGKYYSYNMAWDICGCYRGESEKNDAFFKKIPQKTFQLDLYNILKDSLYYIPNRDTHNKQDKTIEHFPNGRIKIFFAADKCYTFDTQDSAYSYRKAKFMHKRIRRSVD